MLYFFYVIQLSLLVMTVIAYCLMVFWYIPDQVPEDKQTIAANYTNYAFTAITTLLFAETAILGLTGLKQTGGSRISR